MSLVFNPLRALIERFPERYQLPVLFVGILAVVWGVFVQVTYTPPEFVMEPFTQPEPLVAWLWANLGIGIIVLSLAGSGEPLFDFGISIVFGDGQRQWLALGALLMVPLQVPGAILSFFEPDLGAMTAFLTFPLVVLGWAAILVGLLWRLAELTGTVFHTVWKALAE